MIEKVQLVLPVCFLNTGAATHVNCASQSASEIDHSVCGSPLFHDLEWTAISNCSGSDHLPLVVRKD